MPTTGCSEHPPEALQRACGDSVLAPTVDVHPKRSLRVNCLAPIIALLIPIFFSACTMQTDSFDSDTWKAQRGVKAPDNKRIQMVSALEASVRVGMPRADVIRLLGEPDSHDPQSGTDQYLLGLAWSPDEKYYEIGYQNGVVATLRSAEY